MEVGPVDVYIIGFPGNKFTGKIAPAIQELVDNGTIRILDLLFVMKDEDGRVATLAIEDLDAEGAAFAELDITEPGSLNEEDADEVSEDLPANSCLARNRRKLSDPRHPVTRGVQNGKRQFLFRLSASEPRSSSLLKTYFRLSILSE